MPIWVLIMMFYALILLISSAISLEPRTRIMKYGKKSIYH